MADNPETIRITLFTESYGDGIGTKPLRKYMADLQAILDGVPEEFRDRVMIRIEVESGYYGEYNFQYDIWYDRLETPPEVAKRVHDTTVHQARYRAENERLERAQYERLKRKYEGQ